MSGKGFDLETRLQEIAGRWSQLTPLMVQMAIIEDLLNRKIVVEVRGGESFTLHISDKGMRLERGRDAWAHGFMRTTSEQWRYILEGEKPVCAIFRMELEPKRDPVRLAAQALEWEDYLKSQHSGASTVPAALAVAEGVGGRGMTWRRWSGTRARTGGRTPIRPRYIPVAAGWAPWWTRLWI